MGSETFFQSQRRGTVVTGEKEHGCIGQSMDQWFLHLWPVGQLCSLSGNKRQNQIGAFYLDLFGSNDYIFNTCAQWSLTPVGKHEPQQMHRVLLMSLHCSGIPEPSVTSPTTRSMLDQLAGPGSVQSPCPGLLPPTHVCPACFPMQPTHQLLCSALDSPSSTFKDAGLHETWYLITVRYSCRALATYSRLSLPGQRKGLLTAGHCCVARPGPAGLYPRTPCCCSGPWCHSPLCYPVIEGRANYVKQYVFGSLR